MPPPWGSNLSPFLPDFLPDSLPNYPANYLRKVGKSFIWKTIYRSWIFKKVQLSGLKTNFESFEVIKDCYWRCYNILQSADLVLAHKGTLPSFHCSGYLSPCSLKDTLVLYGTSYCYLGLKLQIWRKKCSQNYVR